MALPEPMTTANELTARCRKQKICAFSDERAPRARHRSCLSARRADGGIENGVLRRHLPVVRRRFALSTFTLPSEGSYHLFAGVDRADLLRRSKRELVALQFEEPDWAVPVKISFHDRSTFVVSLSPSTVNLPV